MDRERAQQQYKTLLGKIVDLGTRQEEAFGEQIRCQLGCDACCRPPDSLFLIEIESLQRAIRRLNSSLQTQVHQQLSAYQEKTREMCPLLVDGGCIAYEGRPTICRSHGYAMWHRETEELSWCPLNFTEKEPTKEIAFDVDRLNQMLSLMTTLTWPQAEEGRRDLVAIIQEALEEGGGEFGEKSAP